MICCDSQSAIYLEKNPTFHAKTKHIDVQYHFICDMVDDGMVNSEKVDTLKNFTDVLIKPMSIDEYKWFASSMGLGAYDLH